MVMIGADSHKRTHTFIALDEVGRRLGTSVGTNTEGHLEAVGWAAQFADVSFALEDCRHLIRRLEADMLTAGCRVVRVPTKLMAGARKAAREPAHPRRRSFSTAGTRRSGSGTAAPQTSPSSASSARSLSGKSAGSSMTCTAASSAGAGAVDAPSVA